MLSSRFQELNSGKNCISPSLSISRIFPLASFYAWSKWKSSSQGRVAAAFDHLSPPLPHTLPFSHSCTPISSPSPLCSSPHLRPPFGRSTTIFSDLDQSCFAVVAWCRWQRLCTQGDLPQPRRVWYVPLVEATTFVEDECRFVELQRREKWRQSILPCFAFSFLLHVWMFHLLASRCVVFPLWHSFPPCVESLPFSIVLLCTQCTELFWESFYTLDVPYFFDAIQLGLILFDKEKVWEPLPRDGDWKYCHYSWWLGAVLEWKCREHRANSALILKVIVSTFIENFIHYKLHNVHQQFKAYESYDQMKVSSFYPLSTVLA